jgi:NAD-dependent SIR2 family protein deacetylase
VVWVSEMFARSTLAFTHHTSKATFGLPPSVRSSTMSGFKYGQPKKSSSDLPRMYQDLDRRPMKARLPASSSVKAPKRPERRLPTPPPSSEESEESEESEDSDDGEPMAVAADVEGEHDEEEEDEDEEGEAADELMDDDVHRYEQLDAREVYEPPKMETYTIPRLARDILSGEIHNIIVMTGAGISNAAGIPDYSGKPLMKLALTASSGCEDESKSHDAADADVAAATATAKSSGAQVIRSYSPDHPVVQVLQTAWSGQLHQVEYKSDGRCWVYGENGRVGLLEADGRFTDSRTKRPLKTVPEFVRAFIFDTNFVKKPDPLVKVHLPHSSSSAGENESSSKNLGVATSTRGVIRSYSPDHPVLQVLQTALRCKGGISRIEYREDGKCWVNSDLCLIGVILSDGECRPKGQKSWKVPEYVRAFLFDTDFVNSPDPLVTVHNKHDAPAAERRRKVADKKECDQWSEAENSDPMPELDALPDEELHTIFELVQHKFRLATPGAWMSPDFFKKHPAVFYQIVRRLRLNDRQPTLAHHFIAFLHQKNRLQRHYTQNVDGLHRKTTHMSFRDCMQLQQDTCGTLLKNYCEFCQSSLPEREYSEHIRNGTRPTCVSCKQQFQSGDWQGTSLRARPDTIEDVPYVRPEVVLNGEDVPSSVMHHVVSDFQLCDLVIVIGSSLTEQPFARWLDMLPTDTPRLLINKEPVHEVKSFVESTERKLLVEGLAKTKDPERKTLIRQLIAQKARAYRTTGFDFKGAPHRDVFLHASADIGVLHLLDALQWREEFATFVGSVAPCSALSRRTLAGWKPYLKGPAPPRRLTNASVDRKRKLMAVEEEDEEGDGGEAPVAALAAASRSRPLPQQLPSKKLKMAAKPQSSHKPPQASSALPSNLPYSQNLPTASLQLTLKATAPNGAYEKLSAREEIMKDIARERRRDASASAEGRDRSSGKKKRAMLMSFLAKPPPPPNPTMLKRRLTASSNSVMRSAPRPVGRNYDDEDEDDQDPEDW